MLAFITSRIVTSPSATTANNATGQGTFSLEIKDLTDLLKPIMRLNDASDPPELCLSLWDLFLFRFECLDSIHALSRWFQNLIHVFAPIDRALPFSRTSLIGVYVRTAILEFEKLNFLDVMRLWRQTELWHERMPKDESATHGGQKDILEFDAASNGRLSQLINRSMDDSEFITTPESIDVAERVLEFQASQMQSMLGDIISRPFTDLCKSSVLDCRMSYDLDYPSF